jgi:hypothetical protein
MHALKVVTETDEAIVLGGYGVVFGGEDLEGETFTAEPVVYPGGAQERLEAILTYSPMLRFVLVDKTNRLFQTYRFSFLGDIDDWLLIGTPGALPALLQEYAPHLEQDSYYELY